MKGASNVEEVDTIWTSCCGAINSLDAVRAFAGEQYETAVISDEARVVLRAFETTARHFTVVVAPNDPT